MNFKPYSMFFSFTLILGIFIVLSSNNWFMIWMGLELNLYSFIPIMLQSNNNTEKEAAVKYFLVQALASGILLTATFNSPSSMISSSFLMFSLLMKLGMAPCHFWLPSVMNSLPWNICLILSTVQKIAPLFILFQLFDWVSPLFLTLIAMLSGLTGALGGLNQTQLRPLLAYSSIGHLGWMAAASIFSQTMASLYFLIYLINITSLMTLLMSTKMLSVNSLLSPTLTPAIAKTSIIFSLFSLGGLPPFLGFYPKLLVILSLMKASFYFMALILIISSTINLFFYMKIISGNFFMTSIIKTPSIPTPLTSMWSSFLMLLSTVSGLLIIFML